MKSNIPLSEIKAIIFDMDELMIDSHPVHRVVLDEILRELGVTRNKLTKEEELSFFGMKIIDICAFLIDKYRLHDKISAQKFNEEFNKRLLKTYKDKIQAMPGLIELIQKLVSQKLKLALASSARRVKIDIVLKKFHLTKLFQAVVSGEDEGMPSKPAPDMFLAAAEKLNVDPTYCLVLEDAKNGVLAAKAAGMYIIGVHNIRSFKILGVRQDLHAADLEVEGLDEIKAIFSSAA